jgi:hypothetical protein
MGLHICRIEPRGTDARGEWVMVANDATTPATLTGLELTDYTATQQHVHVLHFPADTSGNPIQLAHREAAFVFTGQGHSQWVDGQDGVQQLLLFAGRSAPVWNNTGDVAYLRRADGTFVDSMTVGEPTRHPNGH